MSEEWSDAELAAAVEAYFEMAHREEDRKPYSKRQVYREPSAKYGRTPGSFEFRMQNISAVLDEMGLPWLPGLKPAANVGAHVRPKIVALIEKRTRKATPRQQTVPEYKDKLPAIRDWLIEVARRRAVVTYGEVMSAFGVGFRNIRRVMDFLGHQAENRDEPIITALIVGQESRRCSLGFAKEFGIQDDEGERQRLYEYWSGNQDQSPLIEPPFPSLEVRAARFVSVEARPDQAAFRRAVFLKYGGKCVISGCSIVKALDAGHKDGCDWRKGHNRAEDGLLLRKDLHALYDNGLLKIGEDGSLSFESTASEHYAQYTSKMVVL